MPTEKRSTKSHEITQTKLSVSRRFVWFSGSHLLLHHQPVLNLGGETRWPVYPLAPRPRLSFSQTKSPARRALLKPTTNRLLRSAQLAEPPDPESTCEYRRQETPPAHPW